jgi:hypothetical protein
MCKVFNKRTESASLVAVESHRRMVFDSLRMHSTALAGYYRPTQVFEKVKVALGQAISAETRRLVMNCDIASFFFTVTCQFFIHLVTCMDLKWQTNPLDFLTMLKAL